MLWQLRGGCAWTDAGVVPLFPYRPPPTTWQPGTEGVSLLCAQVEFRRLHDGEFSNAPRLRRDYLTAHPMAAAVLASSAGLSPALCQVRLARR